MRNYSPYVALPFDPGRKRPELVGFLLHPVSRSETRRRLGTWRTWLRSPQGFHSKSAAQSRSGLSATRGVAGTRHRVAEFLDRVFSQRPAHQPLLIAHLDPAKVQHRVGHRLGRQRVRAAEVLRASAGRERAFDGAFDALGFGVEASKLISYYGIDVLGLRRIEAKVYAYNTLSINSLKRHGFQQEGILRKAGFQGGQACDVVVFGILREEIEEQRRKDGL